MDFVRDASTLPHMTTSMATPEAAMLSTTAVELRPLSLVETPSAGATFVEAEPWCIMRSIVSKGSRGIGGPVQADAKCDGSPCQETILIQVHAECR